MSSAIPCASCGRPSVATRPWRAPQPECRDCREVRRGKVPHNTRVPERVVQQQIVHLLRSLGAQVWVLGTVRPRGDTPGTRQTPGIGDLFACLRGRALWVECKAAGGRLRPEQAVFRAAVRETPCHHVVGGVDEVVAWLVAQGILRADAVAHYRVAAKPPREGVSAPRPATTPSKDGRRAVASPSVNRSPVQIDLRHPRPEADQ